MCLDMKKGSKIILWSSVAIVAIAGICLAGAQMMLDYALQPENDGQDIDGSYKYMYDEYPFLRPWVDSLRTEGALRDTSVVVDGTATIYQIKNTVGDLEALGTGDLEGDVGSIVDSRVASDAEVAEMLNEVFGADGAEG